MTQAANAQTAAHDGVATDTQPRGFYTAIDPFDDFARVIDAEVYRPLPDDWWIGQTDVVGSMQAMAEGRFKAINMAGAAAISDVMNALGHRNFPFVFGGDGASFAVAPADHAAAAEALARTAAWVADDLDLELRAAMIPLADVKAAGNDVLVGRFAASPEVSYAMFTGGGLAWAETAMKAGRYAVAPAPAGTRPDLTGLSCRWTPIGSRRGSILSLIMAPAPTADIAVAADAARQVIEILARTERGGHPVPARGPHFRWPPSGLDLEARASRGDKPVAKQRRALRLLTLIAWLLDRTRIKIAGFDPTGYRVATALNTDFRKFDDALRLTVDCDAVAVAEIKDVLQRARDVGAIRYGLHEQQAALMTCIVPSALTHDHMHFLDGAEGGYARAAAQMKAQT